MIIYAMNWATENDVAALNDDREITHLEELASPQLVGLYLNPSQADLDKVKKELADDLSSSYEEKITIQWKTIPLSKEGTFSLEGTIDQGGEAVLVIFRAIEIKDSLA